jgi:hypothetical protein
VRLFGLRPRATRPALFILTERGRFLALLLKGGIQMRFELSANRLVSRRVEECNVGEVKRFASVLLTCLAFAAFVLICLAVALARTVSAATITAHSEATITAAASAAAQTAGLR